MARAPKTSPAKSEGFTVLSDDELRAIVDGRTRQLEAELAGHRMQAAEEEADPHVSGAQSEQTSKTIQSLEARLEVLRDRRAALGAPGDDDAPAE